MKKLFYLLLFFPALVLGQSTDQNYVKSTVYKVESTTALPASPAPEDGLANITYFDGLGRPVQQIAHKQSGTGKDIITHIEYDLFGRQAKEFLPYVTTAANPNFRTDAPTRVICYYQSEYNDSYPFSEKQFEPSPLNRILKQGAPGEEWQVINSPIIPFVGQFIEFDYQTNKEDEVKLFKAITSTVPNGNGYYTINLGNTSGNVYYPPYELYKTTVFDENNSKTEEFRDKEGRTILKRVHNGISDKHDTYYVYDIYGNLTYVIPPKAVDLGTINTTVLNNLCYQYRYDSRNRLVEKKIPGRGNPTSNINSGWEYIVYDKLDRVVATGPALFPFTDNPDQIGWLITKYDVLGRVAYTGWNVVSGTFNSGTRSSLQTLVNNMANLYVTRQSGSIEGVDVGYANNSTQPTVTRVLTINYYDNYVYPNPPTTIPTSVENQNVTDKTKGLPTGSWVRVLTTTGETLNEQTHTFYDSKARPIKVYQKNHLEGYTQTDTKLDFIGNPQYTITKHKRTDSDTEITVREDFEYTPQGRLLEHKHRINNLITETLSHNIYDELGQLDTKKVGRTQSNPLQEVDYNYNIRGWLTDINDVDDLGDDLFAFKISYNETAHPYSGGMPVMFYARLYNGNISETYWRTSSDNVLRKYGYRYDNLNRLTDAFYIKPTTSEATTMPTHSYNEHIEYDKNGNIMSLQRYGDLDNTVDQIQIDNLSYEYDNGNRLKKVTDNSNHPKGFTDGADNTEEYGYDIFGNMNRDDNKGITDITYNHLNLPKKIEFASNKHITYLYNALGQKLRKVVTNVEQITTTDYKNGFHYENEVLKFIATSEGYVNHTIDRDGNSIGYNYVYNYTDHLGNIRVSYSLNPANNQLRILEQNHYYSFGLKHTNYNSESRQFRVNESIVSIELVNPSARRNAYQYKYNGMEWQDELGLNFYDYGARNYDPAIGRWMNIDPLAENSRRWTPYNYAYNNPVYFIDPDGMQAFGHLSDLGADIAGLTSSFSMGSLGSDHIIVTKGKKDGTYTVKSGESNNDRGIYLDDGKGGKGEKVGTMMTTHSFFNEQNEAVKGAVIDMNSTDGQNFLDTVIEDNPSLFRYMINATNNGDYDFKAKGINDRGGLTELQYKYRGSVTSDGEVGSARDFGNFAAGLVAARSGLSWQEARLGFDMYQGYKSNGIQFISAGGKPIPIVTPVSEAPTTIKAQMTGFLIGSQQYKR